MPGVWKKALGYLGLVEEEGYDELDEVEADAPIRPEPVAVRGLERGGHPAVQHAEHIVRTIPQPRSASASIHKTEPKRFNEARDLGDRFRDGVPVIMNLQGIEEDLFKRLTAFASGLAYGLEGRVQRLAPRVYLITPANVEVSAEERRRLMERGFFDEF